MVTAVIRRLALTEQALFRTATAEAAPAQLLEGRL